MRYFIYCRKSSETEDRQVASIESQLTTLQRAFGDKPEIEIVAVYEEAFSAKAPGRQQFGEMLDRIEKGEAEGIVAWAPDRLARNSVDGGRIVYMLDRGAIRDLKFATYTFENNSQGKFMLQIMFGQSKYYSDALSDNVKRGNRTKIEKGWKPNKPPIGYLNDVREKTIVRDPDRFEQVRQIFDLFLRKSYTPREIWILATTEWNMRTPVRRRVGGRLIAPSYIYKILENPFYAGVLAWNGRNYPGAHEPIISMDEFDRVQERLRRPNRPRPQKRRFAFTGLLRCGECGRMITAQQTVNRHGTRYTYYRCSKRRPGHRCLQRYVSTSCLERQIEEFLCTITLSERFHQWAVALASHFHEDDQQHLASRREAQAATLSRLERALSNLTSLRVRDMISDAEFVSERKSLEEEQLRLRTQLQKPDQSVDAFEPLDSLISFRTRALDLFRNGDEATKHQIFEIVGSNPVLKDGILSVEAKKPFRFVADRRSSLKLRAVREDVRTLLRNNDPEFRSVLERIKALQIKFGTNKADGTFPLLPDRRKILLQAVPKPNGTTQARPKPWPPPLPGLSSP